MRHTHYRLAAAMAALLGSLTFSHLEAQEGGPGGPLPASSSENKGEWIPLTPLLVPRQESGVAALNGKIYVMGGMQGGIRLSSVEVYDPTTAKWSFAAPLPKPEFDHMGAAVVDGKLYTIGGIAVDGSIAAVWMYDPATDAWTRKADMPTRRGATGVAVIEGLIYVAGGYYAKNSVTDFARYDPQTNKWQVLPPLPTPRDHLVAAAVNGKFHAIGGQRLVAKVGPVVGAHEVFDPATGKWSTRAPLLTPRSGMGVGTLQGRIQVFGGENNPNRPEGTFAENEEYNPLTDKWRALAPLPVARHGAFGATLGEFVYATGGGPQKGYSDCALVDAFRYIPSAPLP